MLTRGREAAARATPDSVLSPLPRGFVRAMFLLLPDTRLRCIEVNRAWRALLADTTLFASLDLSSSSGLARFSPTMLRAAVAKAGGQLRTLDLTGEPIVDCPQPTRLMLELVAASSATLTHLRLDTGQYFSVDGLRRLLQEAPALELLEASSLVVDQDHQVVRAVLRNEPPFQALRLRRLWMHRRMDSDCLWFGLALSRVAHGAACLLRRA